MAIHTQQGVSVRIIRKLSNEEVVVQGIDFPKWVRDYDILRLRADGGIEEIKAAMEIAHQEHRASRMPDPVFVEAARRKFDPETEDEKEAFLERMGVVREGK
jgi:hypothetical protein